MKKVLLILTPVVVTLLSLELILRIIGAYYLNSLGKLYSENRVTGEKKITILAVGESTTAGLWYEDDSYPIKLKDKLNKFYECENCAEVQILALPGANTSSTLRAYISELYKVKPDIVLFMTGVNDGYYYSYNFDALLLRKDYQGNQLVYIFNKALISLSNQSKLAKLVKHAYTSITVPPDIISDEAYIYTKVDKKELAKRNHFARTYYEDSFITTTENLEALVKVTRGTNAKPILMTYHEAHINDVIRKVAAQTEVELIDHEIVFATKTGENLISERDNWHPNAAGYELIAENTFQSLLQKDLIKKD